MLFSPYPLIEVFIANIITLIKARSSLNLLPKMEINEADFIKGSQNLPTIESSAQHHNESD